MDREEIDKAIRFLIELHEEDPMLCDLELQEKLIDFLLESNPTVQSIYRNFKDDPVLFVKFARRFIQRREVREQL